MRAERCYTLNEETEIRVGNCFFTRDDLILMYIDSGMDVLSLAKSLHSGVDTTAFTENHARQSGKSEKDWRHVETYEKRASLRQDFAV